MRCRMWRQVCTFGLHIALLLILVWALITMLVYAAPIHKSSMKCFARPMTFHRYSIVAFLSVLVTYFGVNLLLGGIHSYA